MNYWCLEEEKPSLIYPSSIWSMEGSFNSSLCSVWLYLCLFYLRELYAYFFGSFTSVVAYISAFDVCFMISRAVSSAANSPWVWIKFIYYVCYWWCERNEALIASEELIDDISCSNILKPPSILGWSFFVGVCGFYNSTLVIGTSFLLAEDVCFSIERLFWDAWFPYDTADFLSFASKFDVLTCLVTGFFNASSS